MENIFENAKFGDRFKTRDGRMAVYLFEDSEGLHRSVIEDGEYKAFAFIFNYNNGSSFFDKPSLDFVSRWEEPIDEEKLDKIALEELAKTSTAKSLRWVEAFKAGYRKAKENG